MTRQRGTEITITGVVQGVGFRPFVFRLARRHDLLGWVQNTGRGVTIRVDGADRALDDFVLALRAEAPPLARIESVEVADRPVNGFHDFTIAASYRADDAFQAIPPDVATCPDCLSELRDPADRRYRYPFTNCTNCGPRLTIIEDVPYDRPVTTMAGFPLCPECGAEYADPGDRRYHAEPVACPACGPHLWLAADGAQDLTRDDALRAARRRLVRGEIVAVRGLGGFHLACDATAPEAVAALRRRKYRPAKPLAVMMPDLDTIRRYCMVDDLAAALLTGTECPILLLPLRPDGLRLAHNVAPGQNQLGVFLPYTPLHHLLLKPEDGFPPAMVMTSGNRSGEPLAAENDEARRRLGEVADAFLLHNRPIALRCDDSVVRVFTLPGTGGAPDSVQPLPIRLARGYAPAVIPLRVPRPLLATGAELKNTFCLADGERAVLGQHVGDLSNYETLTVFENAIDHYQRLFRIRPEVLACDLHPNYLATRYARERAAAEGLDLVAVQHHHAHIAAVLAEQDLPAEEPVIGVSFDGTGYGPDGAIWGGEFLLVDRHGYRRAAHLRYAPLPGGDAAVREPWRMALAHLHAAGVTWEPSLPPLRHLAGYDDAETRRAALMHQLESGLNAPPTSSMGRLFDAAAAVAGVCQEASYEARAAMEFEALVDPHESGAYSFELHGDRVDPGPLFAALARDVQDGLAVDRIAARFHRGVARMVRDVCLALQRRHGINRVVLSGGVWQNGTLLREAAGLLVEEGFGVHFHTRVPPNDGGLALGQAWIAAHNDES